MAGVEGAGLWGIAAAGAGLVLLLPLAAPAGGDVAYGEYLAGTCITCHRPGAAKSDKIPPLEAMAPEDLAAALRAFRSGARDNPVMVSMARGLSDEDIAALAAYYGQAQPVEEARP
jgi:cytochrome c